MTNEDNRGASEPHSEECRARYYRYEDCTCGYTATHKPASLTADVEAVARAIWDAQHPTGTTWDDWEAQCARSPGSFDGRDESRRLARAAILAHNTAQQSFQARVGEWMELCFTPEIIADKLERADRFIEESLELVQATGYSAERAHALVEYVFNRPVGEPFQEVGGVRVTLAALCNPHGIDEDAAAETELARVHTKIDVIRAKQATKPVGSALPIPVARNTALLSERDRLRGALQRIERLTRRTDISEGGKVIFIASEAHSALAAITPPGA